ELIHILDAVEAPIVVLRRDLMIAGFNRAAADVLRLSSSDIDCAFHDTPVFADLPRLEEQCRRVTSSRAESRLHCCVGTSWFVVRISHYTGVDQQVTGIVLTFTNVTAARASIDQVVYERACTKAILNAVADPLIVLSADLRLQSANRAFRTMFYELGSLQGQLKEMLAGEHPFQPVEVDHVLAGV